MINKIHRIAGLYLSLFMFFVMLTGTLAVFADELDWLFNSHYRVIPTEQPPINLGQGYDLVKQAYPDWTILQGHGKAQSRFSYRFEAIPEGGEYRRIFVDQYQAKVIGDTRYLNVQRFLREVHRNLMLPTRVGIPIVASLSFLLLALLITGLVRYKKFWKGFFKSPNRKSKAALHSSLHRLLGVWSSWFVLVMVLTGVWYFIEVNGGGADGYGRFTIEQSSNDKSLPYGQLQLEAEKAFPELEVERLIVSRNPLRPARFQGQATALLVRERANIVAVDPTTGRIEGVHRGEQLSAYQRLSELADPIHFGDFAGLLSKSIWFLFGLGLTYLSLSGAFLFSHKLFVGERKFKGGVLSTWRSLGVWSYLNLALLITVLVAWPLREY